MEIKLHVSKYFMILNNIFSVLNKSVKSKYPKCYFHFKINDIAWSVSLNDFDLEAIEIPSLMLFETETNFILVRNKIEFSSTELPSMKGNIQLSGKLKLIAIDEIN